ncbi:MAG TPA: hypothetical protein VFI95_15680 [Terriglobales bacterium]|nr:hypothetical protein [Terriglobales bacterium]
MRIRFSVLLLVLAFFAYAQVPAASQQNAPPAKSNPEAERERSGADPVLDLPPLPDGKLTLVGGTVAKLDPIRDRLALQPFGGREMNIVFDVRTKIFRNGAPARVSDIRPGNRVYVDTMLNGDQVFARSIRIETNANQGDARGQVVALDSRRGLLTLHEEVAPQPFKLHITPQTNILIAGRSAPASDLRPGALVVISFEPGSNSRDVARQIRVVANPGQRFLFSGKVTFLDMRAKRLAIANQTDHETYDIALDVIPAAYTRELRAGSEVTIGAVFDGKQYQAHTIDVVQGKQNRAEKQQ